MENAINNLASSIDFNLVWPIVTSALGIMILLAIKDFIANTLAWWKFKSSLDICNGTWVRYGTSVGAIDCRIIDANRARVILMEENKSERIVIPTVDFVKRDWRLINREPSPHIKEKTDK